MIFQTSIREMVTIQALAEEMIARIANLRNLKNAAAAIRKLLQAKGIEFVPYGVGNRKTDLPGFYRKVGDTCPQNCPYLGKGCYSEAGRTALQQTRASNSVEATVASFLACVVLSQRYRNGWPARMFVSGDIYRDGEVDRELVEGLKEAATVLREIFNVSVVGYGYSHCHDKALLQELSGAGIEILESDHLGAGGTVVYPHNKVSELADSLLGFKLVKCPSQTTDHKVKCATCRLCKEARQRNLCVAFDPHGPSKNNLALQF